MPTVNVTLAFPARINGKKHAVTGKPIEVDAEIAEQLAKANALAVDSKPDDDGEDPALSKLKKDELIAIAKQLGVEVSDEHTKANLIELIELAREQK